MKTRVARIILLMVVTVMLAGCDFVAKGEFYNLGGIVTYDDVVSNNGKYPAEGGAIVRLENMHLKSAGAYAVYTQLMPDGSMVVYPPIYLAEGTANKNYDGYLPAGLILVGEFIGVDIPTIASALWNRAELVIPMGNEWIVNCVVYAATNKGPFTITLQGASASYQAMVEVPDLTDMTETEVKEVFEGTCLMLNIIRTSSETVPAGQVIDWSPKGSAPCGTTIDVFVSTGPASSGDVEVPDLTGLDEEQVITVFDETCLTLSILKVPSDEVPIGQVVNWSPKGLVPCGTMITVLVSSGPTGVEVPDVAGMSQGQATAVIVDAGLSLGLVTFEPSELPEGQVVSSDPAAGSLVALETAVDIVVSTGPFSVGMSVVALSPASGSVFNLYDDVTVKVLVKGDPAKGPYKLIVSAAVMPPNNYVVIPIEKLDYDGQVFSIPFNLDLFGDCTFGIYLENKDGVYLWGEIPYTVLEN